MDTPKFSYDISRVNVPDRISSSRVTASKVKIVSTWKISPTLNIFFWKIDRELLNVTQLLSMVQTEAD